MPLIATTIEMRTTHVLEISSLDLLLLALDPTVGAKVTVAAPALLFIAVEITFSMNCPSGFWLEVEIE